MHRRANALLSTCKKPALHRRICDCVAALHGDGDAAPRNDAGATPDRLVFSRGI